MMPGNQQSLLSHRQLTRIAIRGVRLAGWGRGVLSHPKRAEVLRLKLGLASAQELRPLPCQHNCSAPGRLAHRRFHVRKPATRALLWPSSFSLRLICPRAQNWKGNGSHGQHTAGTSSRDDSLLITYFIKKEMAIVPYDVPVSRI